jgi:urease accessory protein
VLAPGRITLLRSQAGPLAGDHDRVEIVVESGTLEIEPIAATVALPGPARTVLELDVTVGDGARLVLEDAPLIVAEGADVLRTTTIRLGVDATAVVRDLVVLGRAGEGPGRLESVLRVDGPDGVILHDALRIDPDDDDAYVALAPGHRAVGMVVELGGAGPRRGAGRPGGPELRGAQLAGGVLDAGGFLWRASAASAADVVAQLARVR